jgi:hypothetical protein
MGIKATSLVAALFVSLISTIGHTQEFFADVVFLHSDNLNAPADASDSASHPSAKLYVSKDKIRLETNGLTGTIPWPVALQPKRRPIGLWQMALQNISGSTTQMMRVRVGKALQSRRLCVKESILR